MKLLDDIGDYWSKRSECFSESINKSVDGESADVWRAKVTKNFDISSPKRILDIGTGPGFFPIILNGYGHDITAIDYSEGMLEKARSNCEERCCEAKFMQMDAHNLDFQNHSFDLILSRNLIWNLEKPKVAYREWMRVLRPGGTMMIFDGNHYLYLFDEEYADSRHASENDNAVIGGVDVRIMRDIAKGLPLSKERRPQWDINVLMESGATSIKVEFDKDDTICVDSPEGKVHLPDNFMICVVK